MLLYVLVVLKLFLSLDFLIAVNCKAKDLVKIFRNMA